MCVCLGILTIAAIVLFVFINFSLYCPAYSLNFPVYNSFCGKLLLPLLLLMLLFSVCSVRSLEHQNKNIVSHTILMNHKKTL